MRFIAFTTVFAALCSAADPTIAGPVLGYLYDARTQSIRTVNGIPGSATVGAPVQAGLKNGAVSALGRISMACADATGVTVAALGSEAPVPLGGVDGCPDAMALSPTGSAAVAQTGGALLVFTGLPTHAAVARTFEVPEGATAYAVSDSGAVVYAVADSVLWRTDGSGAWAKVLTSEGITTPSFMAEADSAVIAADGKIWKADAAGELSLVADAPGATAVLAAKDAIFVALSRRIRAIRSDGSMVEADAPVDVTALDHMDGRTVRITKTDESPIWLFVPATNEFLFVPAPEAANE